MTNYDYTADHCGSIEGDYIQWAKITIYPNEYGHHLYGTEIITKSNGEASIWIEPGLSIQYTVEACDRFTETDSELIVFDGTTTQDIYVELEPMIHLVIAVYDCYRDIPLDCKMSSQS